MNYCLLVGRCISLSAEIGKYKIYEFELLSENIMFQDSTVRVQTHQPLTIGGIYKVRGHLDIIQLNKKRVPVILEKEISLQKKTRFNFTKHRLLNQLHSNLIYLDNLVVLSKKELGKQTCIRFKQEVINNNELQVLNFFAIVVGNAKNQSLNVAEGDSVDGLFIVNRNKYFDKTNSLDEIGLKLTNINLTEKEFERAMNISNLWSFRKALTKVSET